MIRPLLQLKMLAIQKPSSGTIQRARDQKFTGMYPQGRPVLSGESLYYLTFVVLSNKQGRLMQVKTYRNSQRNPRFDREKYLAHAVMVL